MSASKDEFDLVFEMLSPEEADAARLSLHEKFQAVGPVVHDELLWADFTPSGRMVRSAATSLAELRTQLMPMPVQIPELTALSEMIADGEAEAGHIGFQPDYDALFWIVPHIETKVDGKNVQLLRGFVITKILFAEIVNKFNNEAGLTSSEARAIFHMVGNVGLRESAALDGVSYETKRAHIKTACQKTYCAGQKELALKVLGQLVHLVSVCQAESNHALELQDFVHQFYPEQLRIFARRMRNGRTVNSIEIGPATGQPVIMVHGLMLPLQIESALRNAHRLNLRIIVPVRDGYFFTRPYVGDDFEVDLVERAADDIAAIAKSTVGRPCHVIGCSRGAFVATRMLAKYPEIFLALHVSAISFPGTSSESTSMGRRVLYGLMSLGRNVAAFKAVFWKLKQLWVNEASFRRAMLNIFGPCKQDRLVLEQQDETATAYEKLFAVYRASLHGVASDLRLFDEQWGETIRRAKTPVQFYHGVDDPLMRAAQLDRVLASEDLAPCQRLDGGHFVISTQSEAFWDRIARAVHGDRGPAASEQRPDERPTAQLSDFSA